MNVALPLFTLFFGGVGGYALQSWLAGKSENKRWLRDQRRVAYSQYVSQAWKFSHAVTWFLANRCADTEGGRDADEKTSERAVAEAMEGQFAAQAEALLLSGPVLRSAIVAVDDALGAYRDAASREGSKEEIWNAADEPSLAVVSALQHFRAVAQTELGIGH